MREAGLQFGRYLLVGVANTLCDLGVYLMLTHEVGFFALHLSAAKALSYLAAVTLSYALNSRWTFGQEGWQGRHLLRYYATVGTGIVINVGIHYLAHLAGAPDVVAVLLAALGTSVYGFILAKWVVFSS